MTTAIFVAKLVKGLRLMAEMKDVIRDTHGNLSCLAPGGVVCIKPSGVPYEDIREKDIVCVALVDGHLLTGNLKPSVDTPHHLAIYRNYPRIRSICHTHSPYAVGHAVADRDIRVCSTEHADYFGHDIRVTGYPDIDRWGDELILEQNEKAVMLSQHGVLTFGDDPVHAVKLAAALENIAQKDFIASALLGGQRPRVLTSDVVQAWHTRYNTSYGQ
ncbi:MAG: class II aldolase/adducin family protein [Acidobacteriaceae bacterium]|nr:class II aldolase/adducin family protein [Acidobacteriaceae bacterium]